MSRPVLEPLVIDGVPAPHRDHRWVGLATMAAYCDCSTSTVWRRTVAGEFAAAGLQRRGATMRYRPSVCLPLPEGVADTAEARP